MKQRPLLMIARMARFCGVIPSLVMGILTAIHISQKLPDVPEFEAGLTLLTFGSAFVFMASNAPKPRIQLQQTLTFRWSAFLCLCGMAILLPWTVYQASAVNIISLWPNVLILSLFSAPPITYCLIMLIGGKAQQDKDQLLDSAIDD